MLTPEQARARGKLGGMVNKNRAAIKRELRAGRLSLAEALEDERAASMTVIALLLALPGTGRRGAPRVLERAGLRVHDARVRDLHPTRRKQIVLALADPAYDASRRFAL